MGTQETGTACPISGPAHALSQMLGTNKLNVASVPIASQPQSHAQKTDGRWTKHVSQLRERYRKLPYAACIRRYLIQAEVDYEARNIVA